MTRRTPQCGQIATSNGQFFDAELARSLVSNGYSSCLAMMMIDRIFSRKRVLDPYGAAFAF